MIDTSHKVPNGWKLIHLGDALSGIDAGVSPKALDRPARAHELGVLKVSAVTWNEFRPYENKALPDGFDATDCPRVRRGDLLLSRANTAELLAAPVIARDDYPNLLLSDKTLRLVPKREVGHAPYLLHILRTRAARRYFESHATGTSGSMRNVSQATIGACPIALPPLTEQRRIAAILNQAEALRAKRRHALAQLDTLTQSLFLDLFGDPVRNPKGTKVVRLSDVTTRITDGVRQKPNYTETGVPFISVKDITTGTLKFNDCKFISQEDHEKFTKRCRPELGDILYTKVGATYGRPALVDTDREFSIYVSVCLLKPKRDLIEPLFLCATLGTSAVKGQADKRIKGIGVPDLHLDQIQSFLIPLPTLSEQREFAAQVLAVERLKAAQRASLAKLDALFVSLQHRAFRGEL